MRILTFWVAKEGKPSHISTVEYNVSSHFGIRTEDYDADSFEGKRLMSQYGVGNLPAIVALSNSGAVLQMWSGYFTPTMDQLKYYVDRNM